MLNIWSESRINEQFIPYSLNFKSFWTRYSILDSKKELLDSKKNYLDSSNIDEIRWRNVINKRRRIDIESSVLFSPLTWTNGDSSRDTLETKRLWKRFHRKLLSIRKENIGKESGPDGPVQQENFSRYVNALSDLVWRGNTSESVHRALKISSIFIE